MSFFLKFPSKSIGLGDIQWKKVQICLLSDHTETLFYSHKRTQVGKGLRRTFEPVAPTQGKNKVWPVCLGLFTVKLFNLMVMIFPLVSGWNISCYNFLQDFHFTHAMYFTPLLSYWNNESSSSDGVLKR